MTKTEIVEHIINTTTLSRSQAQTAVECVINAITDSLTKGESVYLRGFATIKAHTTKERKARNINKGTTMTIPAQRTVKFQLSRQLKNRMNNKTEL
ncbi:MAG: integration host factor subunit beta [Bacteroidales bacterium]|nr:integration host factor subunit beta [Bacteroidales bacterium]MCM1147324.1 integration host factor subunit beta [Bacteroidales bacterium]MCM1206242.1 integration host factor subunit beta [Bacillota bacterium]